MGDASRTGELIRAGVSPLDPMGPGDSKSLLAWAEDLISTPAGVEPQSNPAVDLLRAHAAPPVPCPDTDAPTNPNALANPEDDEDSSLGIEATALPSGKVAEDDEEVDDDEAWSQASASSNTESARLFPLLWPPPKSCRLLPGDDLDLGAVALGSLPDDASVDLAGPHGTAWTKLVLSFQKVGVLLKLASTPRGGATIGSDVDSPSSSEPRFAVSLLLNPHVLPHPSSYRLIVCRSGILLIGSDEAALFYGTNSLIQLVVNYGRRCSEGAVRLTLPGLILEDYPDFKARAVVIDARRPWSPQRLRLLDMVHNLAAWRINTIHLVVADVDATDLRPSRFYQPPPPVSLRPDSSTKHLCTVSLTSLTSLTASAPPEERLEHDEAADEPSEVPDLAELDALCRRLFITLVPSLMCTGSGGNAANENTEDQKGNPHVDASMALAEKLRSRQLSLIFSQSREPNAFVTEGQVSESLNSIRRRGRFNTVHLWGISPDVFASTTRDPLRWLPLVLSAVQESSRRSTSQGLSTLAIRGAGTSFCVKGYHPAPQLMTHDSRSSLHVQEGSVG